MKQCAFQDKTFEDFMKVKGEIMFKTGKNPTHDEVLVFLIGRYKKNGGV
jgi:hypothetical protein